MGKMLKLTTEKDVLRVDMNLLDEQLDFLYGLRGGECASKCYDSDEIDCLDGLIEMCERFRDISDG